MICGGGGLLLSPFSCDLQDSESCPSSNDNELKAASDDRLTYGIKGFRVARLDDSLGVD